MLERRNVEEEIHGVACASDGDENPEFVSKSITSLQRELDLIKKKSAYSRAVFLAPQFFKNDSFNLKFLRAERFDPAKAARRVVKYFEEKLEYFGQEKVIKPKITFADLSENDRNCLMNGSIWFLKEKDRSGRQILLLIKARENFEDLSNLVSNHEN